eukprot:Filipodium_phascolosomae@DN3805_c0_g1_i1.p1
MELYLFVGWKNNANVTPHSSRLENFLHINRIPHTVHTFDHSGPKGVLPWIKINGTEYPDCEETLKMLEKDLSIDMDGGLDSIQRAVSKAFEDMILWGSRWNSLALRLSDPAESKSSSELLKPQRSYKDPLPFVPTINETVKTLKMH